MSMEKKCPDKKGAWNHNFDILEVKYNVLLEVALFFSPYFFGSWQNTMFWE